MMKSYLNPLLTLILIVFIIGCEREVIVEFDDDYTSVYSEDSTDYQIDSTAICQITFNNNQVDISGDGAYFEDDIIHIESGGEFTLSGTLSDGQVKVNAPDVKVKLILNNVDLTSGNGPAIYVEAAQRTILLLNDGTNNKFTDGSAYANQDLNAAIYSRSDLVISGNGTIEIDANYEDGLTSKDGLIINSGNFIIDAPDEAIRGKDYLAINDGSFLINSGGDGLKSDNENDNVGYIIIEKGQFNINATGDGLYAFNDISIKDGTFNLTCGGSQSSAKGLKSGNLIQINEGTFNINSSDDAIHCDADVVIINGNFKLASNDDAIHAESNLTIDYANIEISKSYEGLEAEIITINDGYIVLNSSDDGINAANGSSSMYMGHPMGGGGDCYLYVNGGTIVVYGNGDGVDVNGSIEMTSGNLIVHGPTSNGNGALDYDGTFVMNGGILIAAGSSGMAQQPSSSSSQNSVLVGFSSTLNANTLCNIQDEDGNNLLIFRPAKNYSSIAFSSPQLDKGENYKIYTGGSSTGNNIEGYYPDGTYSEGGLFQSFTVSATTTSVGNIGGGMGGGHGGF